MKLALCTMLGNFEVTMTKPRNKRQPKSYVVTEELALRISKVASTVRRVPAPNPTSYGMRPRQRFPVSGKDSTLTR